MQKRMGCKAECEVQYRSNLWVVRIWTNPTTKQTAFSALRQRQRQPSFCSHSGIMSRSRCGIGSTS